MPQRAQLLDEQASIDEAPRFDTVSVTAQEHQYIDDYNTFDSITVILCCLFAYFNLDYAMTEPSLEYTSLTQKHLSFVQRVLTQTCIITMALMVKPYETVSFYDLSSTACPAILVICAYWIYFHAYQFSVLEGLIFMPWQYLLCLACLLLYTFIKVYIALKIRNQVQTIDGQ